MTLYEAMIVVLTDAGVALHVSEIAHRIASRDLYRKQRGGYPSEAQIHARTSNRRDLFCRPSPGYVDLVTRSDHLPAAVPYTVR